MQTAYQTVKGARLHVTSTLDRDGARQRPPLLVFNGIGANSLLLEPFMQQLPTASITFDLPGIGSSPTQWLPRRFSEWADLAAALLDSLGIDRVNVMGLSWGGLLAQEFALRHRSRIDRLVLAATSTGQLMIPANPLVLMMMATPVRYFSQSFFRRVVGMIYGGDFRFDAGRVNRHARFMVPPNPISYLGQLYSLVGWTSLFRLRELTMPVLVMAGTDDPLIPAANARFMARTLPNARLEMFDCGHMFLLTRLERTTASVEDFLQQHY